MPSKGSNILNILFNFYVQSYFLLFFFLTFLLSFLQICMDGFSVTFERVMVLSISMLPQESTKIRHTYISTGRENKQLNKHFYLPYTFALAFTAYY